MTSISSRESVLLARECLREVIEQCGAQQHSCTQDEVLVVLSRITVDALDCVLSAQPFHSDSFSLLVGDVIERDSESNISKFAYAFSILMGELSGTRIGSGEITVVDDPLRDLNCLPKEEEDVALRVHSESLDSMFPIDLKTEVKLEVEEEEPMGLVEEPEDHTVTVPHFEEPCHMYADALDCQASSSEASTQTDWDEIQADRMQWIKMEMRHQRARTMNGGTTLYKGPSCTSSKGGPSVVAPRQRNVKRTIEVPACSASPPATVPTRARRRITVPPSTSSPPVYNDGKCTGCGITVEDEDVHEQQFHSDSWLRRATRCPLPFCDFRSVSATARVMHRLMHNNREVEESSYLLIPFPQRTLCPYCATIVPGLIFLKTHLPLHKSMLTSQALIYICNECDFKSARVYQMIQHWNESRCSKGLCFDYAVAKEAMRLSMAEYGRAALSVLQQEAAAAVFLESAAPAASHGTAAVAAKRQRLPAILRPPLKRADHSCVGKQ